MTTKEEYLKHRDHIRTYSRKWYEKNKKRQQMKRREYYLANKNIHRAYDERTKDIRKTRKWAESRRNEILNLYGNKCRICGTNQHLQLHHKEYKCDLKCIDILCRNCHINTHINIRIKSEKEKATLYSPPNNQKI